MPLWSRNGTYVSGEAAGRVQWVGAWIQKPPYLNLNTSSVPYCVPLGKFIAEGLFLPLWSGGDNFKGMVTQRVLMWLGKSIVVKCLEWCLDEVSVYKHLLILFISKSMDFIKGIFQVEWPGTPRWCRTQMGFEVRDTEDQILILILTHYVTLGKLLLVSKPISSLVPTLIE